ncbi:hypothetical protein ACFQZE_14930 [Paenibacillus sp. GCM10027627]|uniref:hypothetical protein n=1 Tax=unclassified Paenibacillus TaxID=185978 RepID=UPI003628286F
MKTNAIKIAGYVIVIGIVLLIYFLTTGDETRNNKPASVPAIGLTDISDFKHRIEDTTKRNVPSDPKMMTGYGLRLYNWNGAFVPSPSVEPDKNNRLQLVVSLANATETDDKVGLLLFLDGKLQKYRVDSSKEDTYLYSQAMSAKSVLNVPITLDAGTSPFSKRNLFIVMVNRMDEMPGDKLTHVDFFTLSMLKTVVSPAPAQNTETPAQPLAPVKPIPASYTGSLDSGNVTVALVPEEAEISFIQQPSLSLPAGKPSKLTLRGTGVPGRYATILFRNHQPVFLQESGAEIYWEIKENEMLDLPVTLPAEDGPGKSQFYFITVPLSDQFPVVVNSPKMKNEP